MIGKKIKIIATIGPSTRKLSILKKLKNKGMDIGRINMKHASYNEALDTIKMLSDLKCKILIDIENLNDIKNIKSLKFDYIALSFTESSNQIKKARKSFYPKKVYVIAKIETKKGIKNIDSIIKESDGIMVARGDLGEHIKLTRLPLLQKMIITKCNKKNKFVITATEMLLSMMDHKTPTKAEVSDVANAIFDGSNALMLSEESAIGKYPIESVSVMQEIILETKKLNKNIKRKV